MDGPRLWQLMTLVLVVAVVLAAARFDRRWNSCTPIAPLLAASFACAGLARIGARRRGGVAWKWTLWGLLLGPIGVVLAFSNPVSRSDRD